METIKRKIRNIATKEEVSLEIQNLINSNVNEIKKLINFAKNIMKQINLNTSLEPADFVHTAIEKLLLGERTWDKDKIPNFLKLIKLIIISEIKNNSKKNLINDNNCKRKRFENIYIENEDGSLVYENMIDHSIDIEGELIAKELLSKINSELEKKDDLIALIVLNGKIEGMTNKEIAEENNIDISEVENAMKRIRRLIKSNIN